jgi:putative ABC transport system permease protein
MLADGLRQLVATLRANPGRTVLTLLGIVWGSALVILLVTWASGLREALVAQAAAGGRRLMVFTPGRSTSGVGARRGGQPIRLKREDATLLASQLAGLETVTSGAFLPRGVYAGHGAGTRPVTAVGVEPAAATVMELAVARGRFLDDRDLAQRRRVVVLGPDLARQLLPDRDPLGASLEVNGIRYRVVGVLVRKGDQIASLGVPDDRKLFLPLTTFQQLISGDDHVSYVAASPRRIEDHVPLARDVRKVLGARHGFTADDKDALSVFDVMNFVDLFQNLTAALGSFLVALAVVTLGVGGVGVMNMLLLSVTERSAEIGLRRALGATRRNIVTQFLWEGLLFAAAGGGLGTAIGCLLCRVVRTEAGVPIVAYLAASTVLLGAGLIGLIGVGAGLWPAVRAARVDPSRTLRSAT